MKLTFIESQAVILEQKLRELKADTIGLTENGLSYYRFNLGKIKFNNQSNVQILFRILEKANERDPSELCLIDHGAGIGFWGLLARQCGIGNIICHDISDDMIHDCRILSENLGLGFQHYVKGDVNDLKEYCVNRNLVVDGLASRNVIEHVNDLDIFFSFLRALPGESLVMVITTSANIHNLAVHWQHKKIHSFYEHHGVHTDMMKGGLDASLSGRNVRKKIILEHAPQIVEPFISQLVTNTRGLEEKRIIEAVDLYLKTRIVPPLQEELSNTMEPYTGTWVERLVPFEKYAEAAARHHFMTESIPGFYNEYYRAPGARMAARFLNKLIRLFPSLHRNFSPFLAMRFIRK